MKNGLPSGQDGVQCHFGSSGKNQVFAFQERLPRLPTGSVLDSHGLQRRHDRKFPFCHP